MDDRYLNPAERGSIYEFIERDGSVKNHVVVVSSKKRMYDKIISILMLGDSRAGYDVVQVKFNQMTKYVHVGMVTYCGRDRLGKRVGEVGAGKMRDIEYLLHDSLGLRD